MKKIIASLSAAALLGFGAMGAAHAVDPYGVKNSNIHAKHKPKVHDHGGVTTEGGASAVVPLAAAEGVKRGRLTITIRGWFWLHGKKVNIRKTVESQAYDPNAKIVLHDLPRGHYHLVVTLKPASSAYTKSSAKIYVHVRGAGS